MQERSADARAASDHGITVEQIQLPAGRPFRASCLCGWQSEIVRSRPQAVEAGAEHAKGVGIGAVDELTQRLELLFIPTVNEVGKLAGQIRSAAFREGEQAALAEVTHADTEPTERCRQAAYDEGYEDGQLAARQDAERTVLLTRIAAPARDLPFGIIAEVSEVLSFHGLDVPVVALVTGLAEMIRRTPICEGGRLREDGSVESEPVAR